MRAMTRVALTAIGTVALGGAALAADRASHAKAAPAADTPVVAFVPVQPAPVAMVDPLDDPMFAAMRRQMAEMDAQMAAMMQMAGQAQANGDGAPGMTVSINGMPAGSVSYSFVSTSTGANGCTQTVQMSSTGDGAKPKIVRASSGECGTEPADTSAATKMVSAPAPGRPAPAAQLDRRGNI